MILETISASRITCYLQCPRKFAFRYIEKLPVTEKPAALAFGSAVHSALQHFHEERMAGRTAKAEEIVFLFQSDWAAALVDDLNFKEGEDAKSMQTLGEALIRAYVAEHGELAVKAVESPFEVALADPATGEVLGPNLKGIFDLILDGDIVTEIKTAGRAYDAGTLARHLQLSAYHYAYRMLHGRSPLMKVTALMKQKKPRVERYEAIRTAEDDAFFVRLAAEVVRGIEAGIFPPNPGWPCGDCEFAEPCSKWRGNVAAVISDAA
jgi:putative RecB family exonuclease